MKIIDISHVLDCNTPVFPGDYKLSLSKDKTMENDSHIAYLLKSCLHTGTHIDMPMHLITDDRTAADFPPDCFIGKGVLLDVRGENPIAMKPEYRNAVTSGSIVLLYTGHDRFYREKEYFTGYPAVGEELADFLLEKDIKILGMDTPAPDYPPYNFHKSLLSNGVFVLENLHNLNNLLGVQDFEVIALPLKISAEASFVRAACMINDG